MDEEIDNTAMREAGESAALEWLSFLRDEQDKFEAATTDYGTSYYPPTDEQLSWKDVNNKLVRLDVAKLAIHLVTARIAFKAMPTVSGIIIGKITGKVKEKSEEWLLSRTLRKLPGAKLLESFARFIIDTFFAARTQKSLELTIKMETLGGMKGIRALVMRHKPKRKHTKTVFSRHWTPQQRRANGFAKRPRQST